MLKLGKTHDPRKNAELLAHITKNKVAIRDAVQETERLFQECLLNEPVPVPRTTKNTESSLPFSQKIGKVLFRPLSQPAAIKQPAKVKIEADGSIYPEWLEKLNHEYTALEKMITKEVNVADFGAVGDGKTDCTAAFKKAIGSGRVKVIVPEGVYITKGIRMPSWTWLAGSGKAITTIKLDNSADKGTRLITNAHHWQGNHHIFVENLSLDWNVERLGNTAKTSTWGNHSSCLTYANVTYGWVKDVAAMNPGNHCFDVSSTLYNYGGDGRRARGGSKYIWIDGVTGYGFGDDGITTHHSEYIFISNSHMSDPSGRAHRQGFSNSNGIEIDDGSQDIVLVNNSTARCFGGIEIKAHPNSSAASNVQIIGHLSVNDNRSFNFRHIGHHKHEDPESMTAYHILATNLASIGPIFTHLYKDSTPRGLVVSAYKNVVINQLTAIGDPETDYSSNPVAAIQYQARNIILNQLSFKNFPTAGAAIKIFGGKNRADSVKIHHVSVSDKTLDAVQSGADIVDLTINRITEAPTLQPSK
ncbi:glycosyl hydrolase family 28-related protein [Bacillus rubiinfantis]|uniref:glycosyl hydrolase family 28-related protein n=1 Tax=Bacillus rubiinfantis TaxID=1499680 RepID=UPI0005AB1A47|nr:glycosyl hydrolase family 28-related protein [Bacillus rubiinfantis]